MNRKQEAAKRAQELLEQMTVQEKIGQLCQRLYGFDIYRIEKENGEITFTKEFEHEVECCGGLGTLYGLYRADPWSGRNYENGLTGEEAVKAYNQLQKYVIEHSRLSIPVMMSSECPHGHQALDGYLLPVNLASGASFSPERIKEAAQVCADQLTGMGVDLALVSLLDILRDPRWGRSEECFGEDPYLAACMARAVVEGMQDRGCAVVAKHFCGQGETTGGVNASAARIGVRELSEIHLPAAEACCQAGVRGIMAAYNEIDGIYCHANGWLLNKILRESFGFDGVVMADGLAVDQLDVMTGDNVRSAAAALKAGVDIGLWDVAFSRLEEALKRGLITMEDIDRAALRVLTLKYECGLFDAPFIGTDGKRTAGYHPQGYYHAYAYDSYPQTRQLSEESVVLLKNEGGVLPLKDQSLKIAVIGPNADDVYRQIGDYSPPLKPFQKDGAGKEMQAGTGVTVWEGLLQSAQGRSLRLSSGADLNEAQELAEWCDVAILALGGSSSRFGGAVFDKNGAAVIDGTTKIEMDCGEGVDAADIHLPKEQELLFDRVKETGKKIVTLIIAGRPYAVPKISAGTDALLYAFYPGPMGGAAIADLIYGKKSPSGRLPVSLPRSTGQLPVYYNYKSSYQAMHYYNEEDGALYAFGEGFGYSSFRVSDVTIAAEPKASAAGLAAQGTDVPKMNLRCSVENTGDCDDAIVLQCYRKVLESDVAPRVRELKAFQKLWLKKGEKRETVIPIGREFFAIYGKEGDWEVQSGNYEVLLMDSGKLLWKGNVQI